MEIPLRTGYGFVWDQYGRLVANLHPVAGYQELHVSSSDDINFDLFVHGSAPDKTLAVLERDSPAADLVLTEGSYFKIDSYISMGCIVGFIIYV